MKHTNCAVCAILEAPQQQLQPARVPSKERNRYKTEGGTSNYPTNPTSTYPQIHPFFLRIVKQRHMWIWQTSTVTEAELPSRFLFLPKHLKLRLVNFVKSKKHHFQSW